MWIFMNLHDFTRAYYQTVKKGKKAPKGGCLQRHLFRGWIEDQLPAAMWTFFNLHDCSQATYQPFKSEKPPSLYPRSHTNSTVDISKPTWFHSSKLRICKVKKKASLPEYIPTYLLYCGQFWTYITSHKQTIKLSSTKKAPKVGAIAGTSSKALRRPKPLHVLCSPSIRVLNRQVNCLKLNPCPLRAIICTTLDLPDFSQANCQIV